MQQILIPRGGRALNVSFYRRCWVMFAGGIIAFYAFVCNCLKVEGSDNIPDEGGVLLAANHISGYDTVFLPIAVFRQHPFQMVWAPAKEELFENRFFGFLYRSWGAFPVNRGRDVRAGKHLGELLQNEKVMLFPEGTRNKDGNLGKGNRGVGKLIYDHRPTVIPTSLTGINTWRFLGFGQRGRIHFGEPIDFSDLLQLDDCKATHLLIVERLMAAIGACLESDK